jgi:hypothetical protein
MDERKYRRKPRLAQLAAELAELIRQLSHTVEACLTKAAAE